MCRCRLHLVSATIGQRCRHPRFTRRTLHQAGERFVALDAQPENERTLFSAFALMVGCSQLAGVCHLQPDEVSRYAACLALVWNSGMALVEGIPQRITPASEPGCETELFVQVHAMDLTLQLLRSDGMHGASPALASSLVPPETFLRWLRAVAGALEAFERVRGCPGGWLVLLVR